MDHGERRSKPTAFAVVLPAGVSDRRCAGCKPWNQPSPDPDHLRPLCNRLFWWSVVYSMFRDRLLQGLLLVLADAMVFSACTTFGEATGRREDVRKDIRDEIDD